MRETFENLEYIKETPYSTGEVAKGFNVSHNTIIHEFERGALTGTRTSPSGYRMISSSVVEDYARKTGVPFAHPDLIQFLAFTSLYQETRDYLAALMQSIPRRTRITCTDSTFEAGRVLQEQHPQYVLLDQSEGGTDQIKKYLEAHPQKLNDSQLHFAQTHAAIIQQLTEFLRQLKPKTTPFRSSRKKKASEVSLAS